MTENLLALILLGILIWRDADQRLGSSAKNMVMVSFGLLSLAAIFIHSYQGLYNPDTHGWNQFHEPVAKPPLNGLGDIFDWGQPQFMSTARRNCEFGYQRYHELLPYDTTLGEYRWGDLIQHNADQVLDFRRSTILEAEARLTPTSPPMPTPVPAVRTPQVFVPSLSKPGNLAIYIGWWPYRSHLNYRRSICPEAQIVFRLGQMDVNGLFEVAFLMGAMGEQEFRVSINGTMVGLFKNTALVDQPEIFTVPFEGSLLKPGHFNEISLEMPDARRPRPGEWQLEALAFYQAAIYPIVNTPDWPKSVRSTQTPSPYP